jgi:hypothetical protein
MLSSSGVSIGARGNHVPTAESASTYLHRWYLFGRLVGVGTRSTLVVLCWQVKLRSERQEALQ